MLDIQRIPSMDSRRSRDIAHRKGIPGKKSSVGKVLIEIRTAASARLSPSEMTAESSFAAGVLMSWINSGRNTGQNAVACQSIQRSASKRVPMSAGQSRPSPVLCARYRTITLASQSLIPPSSIVGTRPFGLSARYSAVLLTANSLPASILSYSNPSSPQHQRTFWTLMELARPQIFSTRQPRRRSSSLANERSTV
jgi:hypothetical protein